MNKATRGAIAVIGTIAATTAPLAVSSAQSAALAPSHVTVRATDVTPDSGQTFRLYGAVWSEGETVPATIRVKTYRDGEWVRLRGAVMDTDSADQYRIRIVLQMKGERMLRVVAHPADDDISVARHDVTVVVQ
jgi:hypothetical protein